MLCEPELSETFALYPALAALPASLSNAVRNEARLVRLPAGQTVFDVTTSCTSFLVLLSGSLRVLKPSPTGREVLLYRLQPGDTCILTVACLLGRATYAARGITETDVAGVQVPQPLFSRLLHQSDGFREFTFRSFAERITSLMQLVEEIAFSSLQQRIAQVLLRGAPVLALTHQQLADEVGSVREVISRILKDFEVQNVVRLERGRIYVLEPEALEAQALVRV